jgi:hypothetical protein
MPPHSSRCAGGSVGLVMDKISHGTVAGVSQSSIDFVSQSNRTLANDHIIFLFYLHVFRLG